MAANFGRGLHWGLVINQAIGFNMGAFLELQVEQLFVDRGVLDV